MTNTKQDASSTDALRSALERCWRIGKAGSVALNWHGERSVAPTDGAVK